MADNNLTEADRQVLEEFRRMTRATGDAATDLQKANTRAAETAMRLQTSMTQMSSGVVSFSKALVDGQQGMSKYSAGVTEFGNGISTILKGFGPFGIALGVLVKVLTLATGAVLKNNDQVLGNYDKLSEFGIAGGFTAEKFQIMARNAGYAGERLGVFVPIIGKVGSSLLTIGNSASDGMKRFMDIATVGTDVRNKFQNLGVSQEKLTESQADYIRIQGRYGALYVKDTTQLRQESLRYARNIVELAALTGQSIDQVKKGQDADADDLKFNLAIRREEANQNYDVAQRMRDASSRIRGTFTDEKFVDGFRDIMANNAAVSENAINIVRTLGAPVVEWTKAYKAGTMPMEELLQRIQDGYKTREKELGVALSANAELREGMGYSSEVIAGLGKNIQTGIGGIISNQTTAAMKYNGELKATQTANENARIALSTAFDNLVALISGPVNKAFTFAMNGVRVMVKGILKILPNAITGMTDDEIDEMLGSVSEVQENLIKNAKRQAEVLAEMKTAKTDTTPITDIMGNITGYSESEKDVLDKKLQELKQQENKQRALMDKLNKRDSGETLNPLLGKEPGTKTAGQPQMGRAINIPNMPSGDGSITMPSGKSVPISISNLPSQLNSREENPLLSEAIVNKLRDYAASSESKAVEVTLPASDVTKKRILEDAFVLLADKLDDLVEKMKENSDMQGEILTLVKR
jgi:hypothetical protein